jgi:catechol-2,3-dioxygenase
MLPIRGVFEVAVRGIRDLARAEAFYCDALGLKEGLRDERRNWVFLLAGDRGGMVVLQEDKTDWPAMHFAFSVELEDLKAAAAVLRDRGIAIEGPVFHEWMCGSSVYFDDPEGNNLELFAGGEALP